MRNFSALNASDNLIGNAALAKQKTSLGRFASDLFRRFLEPPIIDHASGIYSAQQPPYFAARKRDEF